MGVTEFSRIHMSIERNDAGTENERVPRMIKGVCIVVIQVELLLSGREYIMMAGQNFFTAAVYQVR